MIMKSLDQHIHDNEVSLDQHIHDNEVSLDQHIHDNEVSDLTRSAYT